MTYVITEPCITVKDGGCVDRCPVDCIFGYEDDDQLYIDPERCIDCRACEYACPVDAIFAEDRVPAQWLSFLPKAERYFEAMDQTVRYQGFRPRTQR